MNTGIFLPVNQLAYNRYDEDIKERVEGIFESLLSGGAKLDLI